MYVCVGHYIPQQYDNGHVGMFLPGAGIAPGCAMKLEARDCEAKRLRFLQDLTRAVAKRGQEWIRFGYIDMNRHNDHIYIYRCI